MKSGRVAGSPDTGRVQRAATETGGPPRPQGHPTFWVWFWFVSMVLQAVQAMTTPASGGWWGDFQNPQMHTVFAVFSAVLYAEARVTKATGERGEAT